MTRARSIIKKKRYTPPQLRIHGDVRTLTQGSTLNGTDSGPNIPGVSTKMPKVN